MSNQGTPGVTVVVCCYNSAKVLPETLAHLARQQVPASTAWEVVVVDNASTDATVAVARDTWAEQSSDVPFRIVSEPQPGLVAARNAGAEAAQFEFLVYCDDDNWLAPDYVQLVHEILATRPEVGVVGGWGEPAFEANEPPWFDRYPQYYATGPQGRASGDVTDAKGFVYGAGLALRRSVWMDVLAQDFESPMAEFARGSNDIEICYLMRLAGTRIYYDERLRFRHFLPKARLSWEYLLDIVENAHWTGVHMRAYRHVLKLSRIGAAYRRPAHFHWVMRAVAILPRWLRVMAAAMKYRKEAWHPTQARERQHRGEWRSWLSLRSGYGELCDRVESVRAGLQERRQEDAPAAHR